MAAYTDVIRAILSEHCTTAHVTSDGDDIRIVWHDGTITNLTHIPPKSVTMSLRETLETIKDRYDLTSEDAKYAVLGARRWGRWQLGTFGADTLKYAGNTRFTLELHETDEGNN